MKNFLVFALSLGFIGTQMSFAAVDEKYGHPTPKTHPQISKKMKKFKNDTKKDFQKEGIEAKNDLHKMNKDLHKDFDKTKGNMHQPQKKDFNEQRPIPKPIDKKQMPRK